ncbi:ParA family protein [Poseidonibacter antarcticus]|uniref:ParA family protein n=1 Tax=Poseidonibacter antarcticus TaxID=2478538 RepID=UPI000EF4897D|nr:ParA family protein [Poseidonibacter antarcticus]
MDKNILGEVYGVTVQKGGVGKSTFSQALAYSFAKQGYKTVLVDLDPQATLTGAFFGYSYGAFSQTEDNGSIEYDISNVTNIFRDTEVEPIIIKTTKHIINPNKGKMLQPHYLEEEMEIDFYPSNYQLLSATESDDFTRDTKIQLLYKFINSLKSKYDKIVIDSPPSFGIITTSILKSAKAILIPIPTKNVDTDGMVGFFRTLDKIYLTENLKDLSKIVLIPNMFDKRVTDAKETLSEIKRIPNLLHETKNLRKLTCKVMDPFPQKACIQEAPSFKLFLAPYIMDFQRSQNQDLILKIDNIAKELSNS